MTEVAPDIAKGDDIDGCVNSKVEKASENGNEEVKTPAEEAEPEETGKNESDESGDSEPKLSFSPKVSLPLVETKTLEDDEEVIVELRARIYRYDTSEDVPEYKERGTGTVKILRHKQTRLYRILMRRDKTLKICANHHITSSMRLNKHSNNSEKVFVYSTMADFYENETNPETFAIRFSSAEHATIFKDGFLEAVKTMKEQEKKSVQSEKLVADLEKIKLDQEDLGEEKN